MRTLAIPLAVLLLLVAAGAALIVARSPVAAVALGVAGAGLAVRL